MSNIIRDMVINKVGVPKFKKFLDLTALRHKLIAGNIANSLTPGYKTKDVDFYEEFRRSMGTSRGIVGVTTNERHIPIGDSPRKGFKVIENKSGPTSGVNNVDIDKEFTNLSVNQMNYTIAARMIRDKFDGLKKAITGRGV